MVACPTTRPAHPAAHSGPRKSRPESVLGLALVAHPRHEQPPSFHRNTFRDGYGAGEVRWGTVNCAFLPQMGTDPPRHAHDPQLNQGIPVTPRKPWRTLDGLDFRKHASPARRRRRETRDKSENFARALKDTRPNADARKNSILICSRSTIKQMSLPGITSNQITHLLKVLRGELCQ